MTRILRAEQSEVFSLMEAMFNKGMTYWLVITGNSMYPFLRDSIDSVELAPASIDKIRRGDIILIRRNNGVYVLHRLHRKTDNGIYIAGDAQKWVEGPFTPQQLKAQVISIKRKGEIVPIGSFLYKSLVKVWRLCLPVRMRILKIIGRFNDSMT